MHSESRVRRSSSSGAPLNGSVRDEPHHSQLSPPSKSVAIPSHTNVSQDGQVLTRSENFTNDSMHLHLAAEPCQFLLF